MSYPTDSERIHRFSFTVGPSNENPALRTFEWPYPMPTPQGWVVVCQPVNANNQPNNWPDQFSVQVIDYTSDSIRVMITRIDPGKRFNVTITGAGNISVYNPPNGWGQNLNLHMLVIT